MSLPFAIEAFEGHLELIPHELSPDGLKAYRPPKCAVFVNSSVDVGRIAFKLCLAGPFAVIRASSVGIVELRQEQQESGRSEDVRGVHATLCLLYVPRMLYHT